MTFHFNNPRLKPLRRRLRKRSTDAEMKLWSYLRNKQIHGLKFHRQFSVGPYILDFYCPHIRLGIELDGSQHLTFENQIKDQERTHFLSIKGIKLLRFWNNRVLEDMDVVLEVLWEEVQRAKVMMGNSD